MKGSDGLFTSSSDLELATVTFMDELACFMDWDLQAIVRGYTGGGQQAPSETTTTTTAAAATTIIDITNPNFPHELQQVLHDDGDPFCTTFPEFSDSTLVFDESLLGEDHLHEPFSPSSTQTVIATAISAVPNPKEVVIKASAQVKDLHHQSPTKKISKKQHNKRVVKQVKEGGEGDAWAWRKYGQKPIKGSPYPRSYYRCSSSKGCLARKQVERSHLDPQVFIVTYTAEHSDHHLPRSSRKTRHSNNNIIAPLLPQTTQQHMTSSSDNNPLEDSIDEDNNEPIILSGGSKQCLNNNNNKKKDQFSQVAELGRGHDKLTNNDDWFPYMEEFDVLRQEFALDSY